MRGLKSISSAAIFMRGHAPMRNIRRRFYRVVESVPRRLVFAWAGTDSPSCLSHLATMAGSESMHPVYRRAPATPPHSNAREPAG